MSARAAAGSTAAGSTAAGFAAARSAAARAVARLAVSLAAIGAVGFGAIGCDAQTPPAVEGDDATPSLDAAAPDVGRADDAATHDAARLAGDAAVDAAPGDAAFEVADAEPDADAPDPLEAPLAPGNAWGPAARVSILDVPANPEAARRAGCLLHGASVGTKLYSLLLLAGGGLRSQVRPGPGGRIQMVLFIRARGWDEGVPASALEAVDLDVLPGVQDDAGGLHYDLDAFVDGDPAAGARSTFADTWVSDGWLDSDLIPLRLRLSLLGSPQVPFTLEQARMTGHITAEGASFRVEPGTIAGYLTLDALVGLIVEVQRFCGEPDPPGVCALIGDQFERPLDELTELIVGFVNGLDVRLDGNVAAPCDPDERDDCNALGVCLELVATPVVVEGARAR